MTRKNKDDEKNSFKVFLSYSLADKEIAKRVVNGLVSRDIEGWFDEYELEAGQSLYESIENTISAGDYVVVLLSESSVKSPWVNHELAHILLSDFNKRYITILPVLIDNVGIPFPLTGFPLVNLGDDFEIGLDRLTRIIRVLPVLDFKRLSPQSFEALIKELLARIGFQEIHPTKSQDLGIDLIAEQLRLDEFGTEHREVWLVELKLYQKSRADLRSLKQLVAYLKNSSKIDKALLVTNSNLTSAALEWLQSIKAQEQIDLQVLDGTELRNLLLQHDDLVQKYFTTFGQGKTQKR